MDAKSSYRRLCEEEASLPVFFNAWWLDVTCGTDGWGVAVVHKGGQVHAALPYKLRERHGFAVLSQPTLTPFLGPWLRQSSGRLAFDYGRDKELMTALIDQLPPFDFYQQNWSTEVTNWLPFYWRDFRQSTAYTYILYAGDDDELLWASTRENIRREIRKARDRFGLVVDTDASLDEFLRLNALTFTRQGKSRSYSNEYVHRIDAACASRNCRRIFVARDPEGRPHAGAYILWDTDTAYYLLGGADPSLRTSGAMSLCLWEAILHARRNSRRFNFEGSMIEPIERFFRAFGAKQVPYFKVSRVNSRLLRLWEAAKFGLGR